MGENFLKRIEDAINRLSPSEFQDFCYFYLVDSNYDDLKPGPSQGKDGKYDIVGTGPIGEFVGHATIQSQKSKLKKKALDDIIGSIEAVRTLNFTYDEIIFLSCKRIFNEFPVEQEFIMNKILPAIFEKDPKYKNNAPKIRFIYGDEMAKNLYKFKLLKKKSASYSFLMKPEHNISSYLLEDEITNTLERFTNPSVSFEKVYSTLIEYTNELDYSFRLDKLLVISKLAYEVIMFNPPLAGRILSSIHTFHNDVIPLLTVICKIPTNQKITAEELSSFLKFLNHPIFTDLSNISQEHLFLTTRVFRALIYSHNDILNTREVTELIEPFIEKNDNDFWLLFLFDLHLRNKCGYISIPSNIVPISELSTARYLQSSPGSPISIVYNLLLEPLKVESNYTVSEFIDTLKDIGLKVKSQIEARWILTAFFRIIPLYDQSEDEIEYINLVKDIVDAFPLNIREVSPHIQFVLLKILLKSFLRRKEIKYLIEYEELFIHNRSKLLTPQITLLQAEYAACLYIFTEFFDIEEITSKTRFGEIILSGYDPLKNSLFKNDLWIHEEIKINISFKNKNSVRKWLFEFLVMVWRRQLAHMIRMNHLSVLEICAVTQVYRLRTAIGDAIEKSLESVIFSDFSIGPTFFARSCSVFRFLNKNKYVELICEYLMRSKGVDQYTIIRNSSSIGSILHWLFYFQKEKYLNLEKELKDLKDALIPTKNTKNKARIHWIYIAGIEFKSRPVDKSFVKDILKEFMKLGIEVQKLVSRKNEDIPTIFSGDLIDLINSYADQGSLFASALKTDIRNPESWNTLATTLIQHSSKTDKERLYEIALIYSVAKCLARERYLYDHKYCYNYIYCRSLSLLGCARARDIGFFYQTIFYISLPSARYFYYKEERIKPFIELLCQFWQNFLIEDQTKILKIIEDIDWLKEPFKQELTQLRIL